MKPVLRPKPHDPRRWSRADYMGWLFDGAYDLLSRTYRMNDASPGTTVAKGLEAAYRLGREHERNGVTIDSPWAFPDEKKEEKDA